MKTKNYRDELEALLNKEFVSAGYAITKTIQLDPVPESAKYDALFFALNNKDVVYRKGKVTPDRPGAFLAVWTRPPVENIHGNKPIPFTSNELDYLFVQVESHSGVTANDELEQAAKSGMFIFPVSLLIEKGIVSSSKNKGKTGFRVFPPRSQDRGVVGTKVFSESGKKTQRWQLPYFLAMDKEGSIDSAALKKLLCH